MNSEKFQIGLEGLYWVRREFFGGLPRRQQRIAHQLIKNGHSVSVYSGPNHILFPENVDRILEFEGPNNTIPVYYHPQMKATIEHLGQEIQSRKVDIVQASDLWGLRQDEALFQRVLGLQAPLVWLTGNMGNYNDFPYSQEVFKKFIKRVDKFIFPSEAIKNEALLHGVSVDKIRVIRNPVDVSIFHPVDDKTKNQQKVQLRIPLDNKILLYVGRFVDTKGTASLLETWEHLHLALPQYHLVMVGAEAPNEAGKYDQFRVKYRDSVMFPGFISDEAVLSQYYQTADAFILPSPVEGFSNVVAEAMACGLPSIVSLQAQQYSGVGDQIIPGYNGTTFDDCSAHSIIQAISQLRAEMKSNALARFQDLHLNTPFITSQYEDVYREVADKFYTRSIFVV